MNSSTLQLSLLSSNYKENTFSSWLPEWATSIEDICCFAPRCLTNSD
jgi:hypothetical protein